MTKKTRSFNDLKDPEMNNQTKTVEVRTCGPPCLSLKPDSEFHISRGRALLGQAPGLKHRRRPVKQETSLFMETFVSGTSKAEGSSRFRYLAGNPMESN